MFPSDDPRKKKLLALHNSHMLEYDKKLHKLVKDGYNKDTLKAEWDRALMEKELFFIILPQRLKHIHDLMQELGIRERKPVEEYLPHGVTKLKIKGKKKKIVKKRKTKKSKSEAAIDLAVKIMMETGGMSEEKAKKIIERR